MAKTTKSSKARMYAPIIEAIFKEHFEIGGGSFDFVRAEIEYHADRLGIPLPQNKGDVVYAYKFRRNLPDSIVNTADEGLEWVIVGAGRSVYRFKQVKLNRIVPRDELLAVKVPNATPEIILHNAKYDEQSLLAKVRYNRLIDIFLGITAYSLQNHLRTTVKDVGQIEIDEIYVGVDRQGRQFIIPVQAKGGKDKHGQAQTEQDVLYCAEKYPNLICRAVSAQFMANERIAMFELMVQDGEIKVLDERHYVLVPANHITDEDLAIYGRG